MRKYISILLLVFSGVICFADLNVFVDKTRFTNDHHDTILNIDYQIPYRSLEFTSTDKSPRSLLTRILGLSNSTGRMITFARFPQDPTALDLPESEPFLLSKPAHILPAHRLYPPKAL